MTENQSSDRQRLVLLEEQLAHQQKAMEEMSDQLAEQWKVVDQLRNKLERLTERFLTMEMQSLDAPANAKPPHY